MSCRTTAGGSVSTSLAKAVTGLKDDEIQHLFHALKREGTGMDAPSELRIAAWRSRQYDLVSRMKRMSDSRRDSMRQRLFRSQGESVPDGATFYAWENIEARARQEVALRSVATAIDLDPPGSQADQYVLGEDGRPTRVWYASYGSNLHEDRFLTYIKGGQPEGSRRVYDGCTDTSLPEGAIPIRFAGCRPHFALTSRVWGGGIAFIDAQKGETAQGLGRAYDISISQFDEVVAQENGLPTKFASPIQLDEALATGRSVIGSGSYETILHIGDYQGAPVLTFTAPFSTRDATTRQGYINRQTPDGKPPVRMPVMTNKPSAAYLRMIGSGLHETFGMDEIQQADYLRGCPGGNRWSRQQMVRILRGEDPDPPAPRIAGDPKDRATATTRTGTAKKPKSKSKTKSPGRGGSAAGTPAATTQSTGSSGVPDVSFMRPDWRPPSQEQARAAARASTGTTKNRPAPLVPGTTIGGRRISGVTRYTSIEDQVEGVRRWQATLREAEHALKAVETTAPSSEVASRHAIVEAVRTRLSAARNQRPVRHYNPGNYTTSDAIFTETNRVLDLRNKATDKENALLRQRQAASGEKRETATKELARVRRALSNHEARLIELENLSGRLD